MRRKTTRLRSKTGCSANGGPARRQELRGRARAARKPRPPSGRRRRPPLAPRLLLAHAVGQIEANAEEMAKLASQARLVSRGQRRTQDRGNVALEMLGVAGAKQHHVNARFVAGKAVGRIDD